MIELILSILLLITIIALKEKQSVINEQLKILNKVLDRNEKLEMCLRELLKTEIHNELKNIIQLTLDNKLTVSSKSKMYFNDRVESIEINKDT